MPLARISLAAGRTPAYLAAVSADVLHESPGIRKEDVMVVIGTTGQEDWSFANGEAAA